MADKIHSPWSGNFAAIKMLNEMDASWTPAKMQLHFRRHLENAFDAGSIAQLERCIRIIEPYCVGAPDYGAVRIIVEKIKGRD